VLADRPLAPAQAAQVGLGVLAALRAAHDEGIVHRDVKPANILVCPDGRAVLTDFGIAAAAGTPAVTRSGALIGSPSYIAPERARGRQADAAGDLWGLGASLYMAVEGHPPFDRDNVLASLTAVVTGEPDPATHAGILWPVISGLLRRDPDKRLDAAEAERMLRRVAAGARAVPTAAAPEYAEPRESTAPMPRRLPRPLPLRPRVALAVAAAVTVAASTATAAVMSESPGRPATSMAASTPDDVQAPPPVIPRPSPRPAPAKTSKRTAGPAGPSAGDATVPAAYDRLASPVGSSRPHPARGHNHHARHHDDASHGHGHGHGQDQGNGNGQDQGQGNGQGNGNGRGNGQDNGNGGSGTVSPGSSQVAV
jgi:serine/threonine protein kinase